MEDIDSNEFGGVEKDVEGEVETRDVQERGRVNFPNKFLTYIGCEAGDTVIVTAQDGEITLKKATADNIALLSFLDGLTMAFEVSEDE
jgi:bifunctional DNA-binding transcriptional regulator/antitoxin component of YhaV-PrlF toxin-antitoxin module